jgi:hypothetical protein
LKFGVRKVAPAEAGSGRKIKRLTGTTEVVPCYKAFKADFLGSL